MNTACHPSRPLPLTTPSTVNIWLTAAASWWRHWQAARQARHSAPDLAALDGLTTETLKDIGAPEWVFERAQRSQERAHQGGLFERDSLHWR